MDLHLNYFQQFCVPIPQFESHGTLDPNSYVVSFYPVVPFVFEGTPLVVSEFSTEELEEAFFGRNYSQSKLEQGVQIFDSAAVSGGEGRCISAENEDKRLHDSHQYEKHINSSGSQFGCVDFDSSVAIKTEQQPIAFELESRTCNVCNARFMKQRETVRRQLHSGCSRMSQFLEKSEPFRRGEQLQITDHSIAYVMDYPLDLSVCMRREMEDMSCAKHTCREAILARNFTSTNVLRDTNVVQDDKERNYFHQSSSSAFNIVVSQSSKPQILEKNEVIHVNDVSDSKSDVFVQDQKHLEKDFTDPLSCKACGQCFANCRCRIETHLKPNYDQRRFECHICQKAFNWKRNLKIHILTHSDVRRFSCEICLKSFKLKQYLKRHEEIHRNEPMFNCKFCDSQFKRKQSLKRHELNHMLANKASTNEP